MKISMTTILIAEPNRIWEHKWLLKKSMRKGSEENDNR